MNALTLRLPDRLKRRLVFLAHSQQLSFAALVRSALEKYADQELGPEVASSIEAPVDPLASLKPTERLLVHAWRSGVDLRKTLPRSTFRTRRKALLPLGIDIAKQTGGVA